MAANQIRIAILAYDGLCTFEYGIAVEIFATPRPEIPNWVACETVSVDDGPIRLAGGLVVEATASTERLASFDLIIVPGWPTKKSISDQLRKELLSAHKGGTQFMAICSGVFLLVELGITENKRITTHWRYLDELRKRAPNAIIEENVLYCVEKDIMTSAGSAAGIDLCLDFVRQRFGTSAATQIAQRLVLPLHREGGQAQFAPRPIENQSGKKLGPFIDEVKSSLDQEWTIHGMAKLAGMSERTLMRRFEQHLGLSPQKWLTQERLYLAREYLEQTELQLDDIAQKVGFKTLETMRHHFRSQLKISPNDYRRKFQKAMA